MNFAQQVIKEVKEAKTDRMKNLSPDEKEFMEKVRKNFVENWGKPIKYDVLHPGFEELLKDQGFIVRYIHDEWNGIFGPCWYEISLPSKSS